MDAVVAVLRLWLCFVELWSVVRVRGCFPHLFHSVMCGCRRCAGGDVADIADKQARYDAALAARDSVTAVLDYSKQPSFEVGTMGFWIATGEHPYGDDYSTPLPVRYDATAFPAVPSSYPAAYLQLMTECVAFDPRDRPDIGVVAARLRELRCAAWMSVGDVLAVSRRLVRSVCVCRCQCECCMLIKSALRVVMLLSPDGL